MFEELNKCVTKSRLSKQKLLKFRQRYNKNRICLEKIEDSCNINQGCVKKIFEKLSISITKSSSPIKNLKIVIKIKID